MFYIWSDDPMGANQHYNAAEFNNDPCDKKGWPKKKNESIFGMEYIFRYLDAVNVSKNRGIIPA